MTTFEQSMSKYFFNATALIPALSRRFIDGELLYRLGNLPCNFIRKLGNFIFLRLRLRIMPHRVALHDVFHTIKDLFNITERRAVED